MLVQRFSKLLNDKQVGLLATGLACACLQSATPVLHPVLRHQGAACTRRRCHICSQLCIV